MALDASFYISPFSHSLDASEDPQLNKIAASFSDPYTSARGRVLSQALSQGYDAATMTERGVIWAEDQDPFGHVTNTAYPRFLSICNYRVMEGMERYIGYEGVERMRKGKGICPVVRGYEISVRRVVQYPDALITANRLTEVKPDRYHGVTTVWSLKQQCVVAECSGWIVWFDFDTGKAADLLQKGGDWSKLYHGLEHMAQESEKARADWAKTNKSRQEKM